MCSSGCSFFVLGLLYARVVKLLPVSIWGGVVVIGSIGRLESNSTKIYPGSKNATREYVGWQCFFWGGVGLSVLSGSKIATRECGVVW